MNQIDPAKIVMTVGVANLQGEGFTGGVAEDYMFQTAISKMIVTEFEKQPDVCTDGGNDKEFFTITFRGHKMFVAANEVNGLTVMLPDEY